MGANVLAAGVPALPARPTRRRRQLVSSGALGMLLFITTEVMMFAGLISAFMIVRAGATGPWPPSNQPRLPAEETLLNTSALMVSGVLLVVAHFVFQRAPKKALWPLAGSIGLGALFVILQGAEWVALLGQGLTLRSSSHGSFFYLIVGAHGLHAICALLGLGYVFARLLRGRLRASELVTAQLFWYFVVLLWPFLYLRVYW